MTKIICYFSLFLFYACIPKDSYDILIRNGMVYDGSGEEPYRANIAINADTIAAIGKLRWSKANRVIDAKGKAVTPGFINMLSQAGESLLKDGRSLSDLKQGITLEVFGEASMGPISESERKKWQQSQDDFDVPWLSLGEYLNYLEQKGAACNFASFIGSANVRTYVMGMENRPANKIELDSMRSLVKTAMQEGALGLTSALIYAPDAFFTTSELVELCKTVKQYNGMYAVHMRSEGNRLIEGVNEVIDISLQSGVPVEIYHLKAAGMENWSKMDSVITLIEIARSNGMPIAADMYTYTAAATGLTACIPPALSNGGFDKLLLRLQDKSIRASLKAEMNTNSFQWENFYFTAGSPDKILLLGGFLHDSLNKYTGKTISELARLWNTSPEEAIMDIIVKDSNRISAAYFLMSEENLKRQIILPWMSFCSDAASIAAEGESLKSNPHPRTYGSIARVIAEYVNSGSLLSLSQAIHQLSKLTATNLKLQKRGELKLGYFADVLVFDPTQLKDHSTFENPHQYTTGMDYVFVNGTLVLENGKHTGAFPGRFIKGSAIEGFIK